MSSPRIEAAIALAEATLIAHDAERVYRDHTPGGRLDLLDAWQNADNALAIARAAYAAVRSEPFTENAFMHDEYELRVHWTEYGGVGVYINGTPVVHAGYADPLGAPMRRCLFTHVRRRDI